LEDLFRRILLDPLLAPLRLFRESSGSGEPDVVQNKLDKRRNERNLDRAAGVAAFNPRTEKIYVDDLLDTVERDYVLRGRRGLRRFQTHLKPIREVFADMRAVSLKVSRPTGGNFSDVARSGAFRLCLCT